MSDLIRLFARFFGTFFGPRAAVFPGGHEGRYGAVASQHLHPQGKNAKKNVIGRGSRDHACDDPENIRINKTSRTEKKKN